MITVLPTTMAETQKEDDDGGFGDFTFAFAPSNPAVNSNQTNGLKASTAQNSYDDDDWGDFVEYPRRSELPEVLSNAQSPPNPSLSSNTLDAFVLFSDHSATNRPESVPGRVESEKTRWVKPKGALPLSLFGNVEDEEESVGDDPHVGNIKDLTADKSVPRDVKNGSNVQFQGGINDIIANLYNQSRQIKAENGSISSEHGGINWHMNGSLSSFNGLNSGTDLTDDGTKLHNQTQQIKAGNGFNSNTSAQSSNSNASSSKLSRSTSDFNGFASNSFGMDFDFNASRSIHGGMNLKSRGLNSSSIGSDFSSLSGLNLEISGLNINSNEKLNAPSSNHIGLSSDLDVTAGSEDFDADDDGWEFQAAGFEQNDKVNGKEQEVSEMTVPSSVFGNGSSGSLDMFATSDEFSRKSHETNVGFDYELKTEPQNGFTPEKVFGNEHNHSEKRSHSFPNFEGAGIDESFGDFTAAFPETGSKQEVDGNRQRISDVISQPSGFNSSSHVFEDFFSTSKDVSGGSYEMDFGFDFEGSKKPHGSNVDLYVTSEQNNIENELNSIPTDGDIDESIGDFKTAFSENALKQEANNAMSGDHKGALPLSIFGDEELETDGSSNIQDVFPYEKTSYLTNTRDQGSNISINDLISNLYGQAEPITPVDSVGKPIENNGLNFATLAIDPISMDGDDGFDDDSWEFKDANAFSPSMVETQTSFHGLGDAHQNSSSKLKLTNHVDFYCQLKDRLCVIAMCHLDDLKKAQSTTALSGKDEKVEAIEEEIQEAYKVLQQENMVSNEFHLEDHPHRDTSLNEFLDVLYDPKFRVLETEYHLSSMLSSAEKDLRSAIGLIKHASTVLKILRLGSAEEQSSYMSAWGEMVSVCAQELKHGAWILKQSMEKNLQHLMLSKPRGKMHILALGEIYRVVAVLGASAKLYKPWLLSNSENSTSIYALLEECHTIWSNSGLEEVLSSISELNDSECNGVIEALLGSIKHIRGMDAEALGLHVLTQQESLCGLSLLTPEVAPGMKMVVWNGERYFLSLVNLWENLINIIPPNLARLNF